MNEHEAIESVENQRKILKRLKVLQSSVEYNRQLLETVVEHLPAQAPNKNMRKVADLQAKAIRPLLEKVNFEGKEELLDFMDSLIGGKV